MRLVMPLAQQKINLGRKFSVQSVSRPGSANGPAIPEPALGEGQTIRNGGSWQGNKTLLFFGGCETPHQPSCLQKQNIRALGMGTDSIQRY